MSKRSLIGRGGAVLAAIALASAGLVTQAWARGKEPDYEALQKMSDKVVASYARESTALFATARLWDDGLIDPRDTRRVVAFCLATALEGDRRATHPNVFGVARL